MINLQKVRFAFFVEQDIESQELKAHLVGIFDRVFLSGPTRPVIMEQIWLNRQQSFNDDVLDLPIDLLDVASFLF